MNRFISILVLFFLAIPETSTAQVIVRTRQNTEKTDADLKTGAKRTELYLPLLKGKKVAVVANHTSMINGTHLVDSLISLRVDVKKILCPEHGFRGLADAGENVASSVDKKTGLPVVSLYGDHKKPTAKDLKGIDVVLFDLQDVGVRFYTYISTMTYVMEACAEQNKTFIVLDRPNPNGYYMDGPVMEKEFTSFVGLHPVPVVHGMTVAEYARMLNGEKWLKNGVQCDLKYITCENYSHNDLYQLPVRPSPNLPNMSAVYLYPSLCFFEGTVISVGRGTDTPFQVIGHPSLKDAPFQFTPMPKPGAKKPLYEGQLCYGYNLSEFSDLYIKDYKALYLYWILQCYRQIPDKSTFFNNYFEKLAGTKKLRQQIIEGKSEQDIRSSWQQGLSDFRLIRSKYLLYEDF
ncbi:MAG: DUF1343 domain-containing protein [Bacteroidia bacterium]